MMQPESWADADFAEVTAVVGDLVAPRENGDITICFWMDGNRRNRIMYLVRGMKETANGAHGHVYE